MDIFSYFCVMENLWIKSHRFILNCLIGDHYFSGDNKISVVKRSSKRIYFSNGEIITIKKSDHGFYYLSGKNVNQVLRDIEGYFLYKIHSFE